MAVKIAGPVGCVWVSGVVNVSLRSVALFFMEWEGWIGGVFGGVLSFLVVVFSGEWVEGMKKLMV